MRTKALFITGLLLAVFIVSPNISKAATEDFSESYTADFSKALSKTIKYPVKASENNAEGVVWVSLDVDENGIMKVDQSNHSCCDKLHDDVIKQLDGKKIKNFKESMIGNHKLKMVFQIEK
jgi:hypothetical protein